MRRASESAAGAAAPAGRGPRSADRLEAALAAVSSDLLQARGPGSFWEGSLSGSALSTATAIVALVLSDRYLRTDHRPLVDAGLRWLARHANRDGGWGDTVASRSNLSTTTLVWAAFGAAGADHGVHAEVVRSAVRWIRDRAGGTEPDVLCPAVIRRYGDDRTFSVPILTLCALSGRLGEGPAAWRHVIPLPFELAACPPAWFAAMKLPVVSYALPALIAIGQARCHHAPPANPVPRLLRSLARERTLRVLATLQPDNGGFLEATPLTSFVTLSLLGSGQAHHPVVSRGLGFLRASQRADGCWPIDTNLSTWCTTLSVEALPPGALAREDGDRILEWLLGQQYRTVHPYTQAAPGGWAWTDLPGGVPDADDTSGALLALQRLVEGSPRRDEVSKAVESAVGWLLDLQNSDGGIPTFCRGWGTLPFDRSSTDITAHAVRAWLVWRDRLATGLQSRVDAACRRALEYLCGSQRADGSWVPLWFGNEAAASEENPTYGTARVLVALAEVARSPFRGAGTEGMIARAVAWFESTQLADGGFGCGAGTRASVEETALAVCALSGLPGGKGRGARDRGVEWLLARVTTGEWREPSPIGFYFARLWYFERLYPKIFTVGALHATVRDRNWFGVGPEQVSVHQ